jgi:hypothetical protein
VTHVVVDPEVPDDAARALESAPAQELIPFSAPPSTVASLRDAAARQARVTRRVLLLVSAIWAALLLVLFLAVPKFSADPGHLGNGVGRTVAAVCIVAVAAMMLAVVWAIGLRRPAPGLPPDSARQSSLRARAVTAYHRRYVVPDRDLRGDALSRWHRASAAASAIRQSEAVRAGQIDSIEVGAVLPYHLWEIAERLALLSRPEAEQQRIVGRRHLDVSDPDVSRLLDRQRRSRDLTLADIESRVLALEEFAELAARADAAVARREGIEELAGLDADYGELEARLGRTENVLNADGHLSDQLRTVTEAADEAVRRMNEAGRALHQIPRVS